MGLRRAYWRLRRAATKALAFWTLAAATAGLYMVMSFWSLPQIDLGENLKPFDMRYFGYTIDQADAYLSALSPVQVAFYRNVQHTLDLFFPPLWALTLFFAIAALAPRWLGAWRWALAAIALPTAFLDWQENFAVGRMLAVGAGKLSEELVQPASQWTVLKFGLNFTVLALLLVLLVARGLAKLRAARA